MANISQLASESHGAVNVAEQCACLIWKSGIGGRPEERGWDFFFQLDISKFSSLLLVSTITSIPA